MATVSGVFKFQNAGDATLNVEPPKASCCWPVAELKADILPPGTAGALSFTLNLGFSRATLEKQIAVRSNDPQTPEVSLTSKPPSMPGSSLPFRALGIRHGQIARKNSHLGSASSRRLPHRKGKAAFGKRRPLFDCAQRSD